MSSLILTPLDGSAIAEQSLPLAAYLARGLGARLLLVRAVPALYDPPRYSRRGVVEAAQRAVTRRQESRVYLDQMAAPLVAGGLRVASRLLDGDPTETIPLEAERSGARYVVMTTRGRGMIGRWALGSVGQTMIRESTVPVILQRARRDQPPPPPSLARILLPVDGSLLSEQVIPWVTPLARAFGSELLLLRALATPRAGGPAPDPVAAQGQLTRLERRLRLEGIGCEARLTSSDPVAAILAAAQETTVGMIAMTTHGRSGLVRALYGSITDAVLRASLLPVLIVRPVVAATARQPAGDQWREAGAGA